MEVYSMKRSMYIPNQCNEFCQKHFRFIRHYIYPSIVWVYKNIIDNQIQSTFSTGSNNFYTMVFNFFPCRASRGYNAKWVKQQLTNSSVSVAQLVCLS